MILGFMQRFTFKGPDKQPVPTNFREKILAGVGKTRNETPDGQVYIFNKWDLTPKKEFVPKIHTFREDPHNRWKPGMSIQMVYRGPKYSILDHFNKGIPELSVCTSKQKVEIKYLPNSKDELRRLKIYVDSRLLDPVTEYNLIAKNDGFQDIIQFMRWFKDDWSGFIIHWTDFRY